MTPMTLTQAAEHYSGTGLTKTAIRRAVLSREIPSVYAGRKYLTTLEAIEYWLRGEPQAQPEAANGGVRRVQE